MNQFSGKSDAQLRFIIKDAAEAATAMRGHDERAEAKYLDQVNDAATELASRLTLTGMAKTIERLEIERKAAQADLNATLLERNPHKRGTEFYRGTERYQVFNIQPGVRKLGHDAHDKTPDTGVWLSVYWWTTAKTWSRSSKTVWVSIKDPVAETFMVGIAALAVSYLLSLGAFA